MLGLRITATPRWSPIVMVYTRPSRHAATMRQSTSNVPVTQMKMGTLASSTWQSLVVAAGSRMMIKRLSVPMTSDETASGSSEFLGIVLMHVMTVSCRCGCSFTASTYAKRLSASSIASRSSERAESDVPLSRAAVSISHACAAFSTLFSARRPFQISASFGSISTGGTVNLKYGLRFR